MVSKEEKPVWGRLMAPCGPGAPGGAGPWSRTAGLLGSTTAAFAALAAFGDLDMTGLGDLVLFGGAMALGDRDRTAEDDEEPLARLP
ncbi:hypothetical protein ACIOWI_21090 [Streptomyces sp. NPDC087659]|uniref:hypothetical protein n=1 Tax=unclassified Streptomyces TaxID=2593676 RepID=UPI0036CF6ED9